MSILQEIKNQVYYYRTNVPDIEGNIKLKCLYMKCNGMIFQKLIQEIEEDLEESIDKDPIDFSIVVDGIEVKVYNNYMITKFEPYYVSS